MDGLGAQDWHDLREAGLLAFGLVATMMVVRWAVRRWRREPVFQHRDRFDLLFWIMISGILAYEPVGRIFDRHDVPGWVLIGGYGAAILLISQGAMRSIGKIQAENRLNAVDNPDGDGRELACKVDLAPEDRKIQFRVIAISLVMLAISIGAVFLVINTLDGSGTAGLLAVLGLCLAMLGGLVWLIKGHWPVPLSLRDGIDIAATPEQVWDVFHYRDTESYYRSIVRRVERLDQPGEVYRLHYFNDERCVDCGLHKNPEAQGRACTVEVLKSHRPSRMVTRSIPYLQSGERDPMMDSETSDMTYVALPGGGCRVTYVNSVVRPHVWLALLLKLGDPIGEHLRDLKAHVEGGEGDTIYDRAARELDCARNVPQYCGCPPVPVETPVTA